MSAHKLIITAVSKAKTGARVPLASYLCCVPAGFPSPASDYVEREIDLFNLKGLEDRHPFSLSGGERRRLSVATMIIARPEVLVLDEPTYGQDKSNTVRMMESLFTALGEVNSARGITLILVTHDMKLVAGYAERVIVMRVGSVAFDGTTGRLFLDPDLLRQTNL